MCQVCQIRNEITPDYHTFLMQGTEDVYFVHFPMFYVAKHRRQLIMAVDLPDAVKQDYTSLLKANPAETFTFVTSKRANLDDIVAQGGSFTGSITSKKAYDHLLFTSSPSNTYSRGTVMRNVEAKVTNILKNRSLVSGCRDDNYPNGYMPFYLYGTDREQNIDHVLVRAPNIHLSAEKVTLDLDRPLSKDQLSSGLICCVEDVHEAAMQPFPTMDVIRTKSSFFFKPGQKHAVSVYADKLRPSDNGPGIVEAAVGKGAERLAKGTLVLGERLFVDSETANGDPFKRKERYVKWKEEFDKIAEACK